MKYIITLAFVVTSGTLLAQWQHDVQLNDNPVPSNITHNKSSIVASGDVLHVVWYESHGDHNEQIYYKRTINNGATWETAKRITNNTRSTSEPVLIVSGDILNIIWLDSRTDMYQTRSVNAGVSWSPERKVTDDAYNSPSAAVSGSIIHLVWSGKVGQIFYKRSTNGGSTWDVTVKLSDRNTSSIPSIAVSNKEVHVVWQEKADDAGGSNGIIYKRSVDAGKNWKADNKLAYETSDFASIALSGKEVYVIWRDKTEGSSTYITNSPDGGVNWRDKKKLTDFSDLPSVAVSGQFVHLVWKSSSSQLNYKRSINGGVTWEPETPILNFASSPRKYSLVANGQRIDMVWDNYQNVFYKRLLNESAKKGLNPKGQKTTSPDEKKTEEKPSEEKTGDEKKPDDKKDTEKWVITPSGAKGITGNVTIALPKDATWYLYFQTTEGKDLVRMDYAKSHALIPGTYNVIVNSVPLLGVPVQKGMNTRLKAGTLYVISTGDSQWGIYDESRTKHYVTYTYSQKLGLPAGKYAISLNGQFVDIEIKDGEVTEF